MRCSHAPIFDFWKNLHFQPCFWPKFHSANFPSQDPSFFKENPLPRPCLWKPASHIPNKKSWLPPPPPRLVHYIYLLVYLSSSSVLIKYKSFKAVLSCVSVMRWIKVYIVRNKLYRICYNIVMNSSMDFQQSPPIFVWNVSLVLKGARQHIIECSQPYDQEIIVNLLETILTHFWHLQHKKQYFSDWILKSNFSVNCRGVFNRWKHKCCSW